MRTPTALWLTGPALEVARTLPDASVDLVATSPPFLALRDYNGVEGQWGSEPTPAAFLDNLLELATELRRVLAPHGSLAFELGDTYSGSGGAGGDYNQDGLRAGQAKFSGTASAARRCRDGWPPAKSMTLVPQMFAASLAHGRNLLDERPQMTDEFLSLIAHHMGRGEPPDVAASKVAAIMPQPRTFEPWLVRNVIVWARNNPPVGALGDKVRPATSYITVACPSPRRWFDLDAVRGPSSPNTHARTSKGVQRQPKAGKATDEGRGGNWASLDEIEDTGGGAPPLDHWHDTYDGDHTWLINTQGSSLAHYAMWPAKLAERLVLAMCPREVCRTCGEPRRRITGPAEYVGRGAGDRADWAWGGAAVGKTSQGRYEPGHITRSAPTLGWSDCGHDDYRPGIVLDPFSGTGTTIHAAEVHGRDGIGIDLDPINATLRDRRRTEVRKSLIGKERVVAEEAGQGTLMELAAGE